MSATGNRWWVCLVGLLALALQLGSPAAGQGGGRVANKAPTVDAFSNTAPSMNEGTRDVLTGEVRDRNGESDLIALRIQTTSGPLVTSVRTLVGGDLTATSEPSSFDASGWKIWNPLVRDGRLSFRYAFDYPAGQSATYVWEASAQDAGGPYQTGPAGPITVTVAIRIVVGASPVNFSGVPEVVRWGGWTAEPGQANVESSNFLKITNTGVTPSQAFTVDFTEPLLVGVEVPAESIAVDGNVQFAWWEDATPSTTAPFEGSYTFGATSPTGSATISFTDVGHIIYAKYRIVDMPDPLLDQEYQGAYVVTAV